jgi:hypothetical protein
MKITLENFEEEFAKSLARLKANIDLEVTASQKHDAEGQYRHVEMNRTYFAHQLKNGTSEAYVCAVCGALAAATYTEPTKAQMLADESCFHCNHWKQLSLKPDPKRLVIDGHIYGDGGNSPGARSDFLGFGGHKWFIERDGKAWETNNLWSGSTVPQAYIEHFPDNAKFLKAMP